MNKRERLTSGNVELRQDGRQLYILALREGYASDELREVFSPGSLTWSDAGVQVRTSHLEDRGAATGYPTRINEEIRITLRPTPELREAVQDGKKYASIEFFSLEERETGSGIRQVLQANLVGVALTRSPSYKETAAELRDRKPYIPELDV